MFTFITYAPIFSQKTPKIRTKSEHFGQNSENHEFTPKIGATNNTAVGGTYLAMDDMGRRDPIWSMMSEEEEREMGT